MNWTRRLGACAIGILGVGLFGAACGPSPDANVTGGAAGACGSAGCNAAAGPSADAAASTSAASTSSASSSASSASSSSSGAGGSNPGNTITAASCSQDDVNAALASANDGDTVLVPAGTCAYTTPTPYTPSVAVTKAVTLKGAGIDQTIISDETGTQSSEDPIELGSGARLTGFSFVDKRTVTDYKSAVATGGTNWRVDHCKFAPSIWVIGVAASGAGVIDHDVFVNTAHGVDVYGDGDAAWSAPSVIGTGNAVYMEDDTFDYASMNDGAYDAYDGATYVFRHNIVNGTNIGNHGFDSGGFRSPRSWEIYDNTFTNAGDHIFITINLRGGSGVIFNNTVQASGGSYDGFAILRNYRSDSGYTSADGDSWGTCDGTNAYDGNVPGWQGYPCKDQIGRGTDQTSFPAYLWNNTFKGSTSVQATIEGYEDSTRARTYHILKGRDYYDNTPKPGYTPFTYPHPLATAD